LLLDAEEIHLTANVLDDRKLLGGVVFVLADATSSDGECGPSTSELAVEVEGVVEVKLFSF
jgi:hypothetical protein